MGVGYQPEPQTGIPELDKWLKDDFWLWSNDPQRCCSRRMHSFAQQERLIARHGYIDGDIFVNPLDSGALQLIEGHRCVTPSNTSRNVVLGILLDEMQAPDQYWFSRELNRTKHIQKVSEIDAFPALDDEGFQNIFHYFTPTRISQTRGITAFKSVFDILTMFEDVNFAKLVQAQVISCIALFIERGTDFKGSTATKLGPQSIEIDEDSTTRTLEEMRPGLIMKGRKGETAKTINTNVPNAEYFDHVRLILRIIGANLGVPLSLVLLDTHDTTFHGYRGEINEARTGFKIRQQRLKECIHQPVWRWRIRFRRDAILKKFPNARDLFNSGVIFHHKWVAPGWQYVDPLKDADAETTILNGVLNSPRAVHAIHGRDFDEVATETCEDNSKLILKAHRAAQTLVSAGVSGITWRDVLNPRTQNPVSPKPVEVPNEK